MRTNSIDDSLETGTPPIERLWSIVVAAGRGQRFGGDIPKQYALLMNEALVVHSLNALCSHRWVHRVLVGLSPDDTRFASLAYEHRRFDGCYAGGDERFVTVIRGLEAIVERGGKDDWVLVHDAARPLVMHDEIDALVTALKTSPDGAVLALPATDAMKRVDATDRVCDVVSRTHLWRALTPQAFQCQMLLDALNQCVGVPDSPLDECEAIQRTGRQPRLVEGRNTNIKITTPHDLALATAILTMRSKDQGARI